jgi:hypothetical protein
VDGILLCLHETDLPHVHSMQIKRCLRIAILLISLIELDGCSTTGASPYGESYEPDSPALPIDPHPAQSGTFSNRTDHTTLSD